MSLEYKNLDLITLDESRGSTLSLNWMYNLVKLFDISEVKSELIIQKRISSIGEELSLIKNFTDAIHSITIEIRLNPDEELVIKANGVVQDTAIKVKENEYEFKKWKRQSPLILYNKHSEKACVDSKRGLKYPDLEIAIKLRSNCFEPIDTRIKRAECYYMIFSENLRMKVN